MPDSIWSATGKKTRFAMSLTASRGVKCSPASSLFSSLKRRISSSKIVPMPWLSSPGCRTVPSVSITGSWTQVDFGRGELLDQRAQGVGLGEARDLVAELEVLEDVLDAGGEAVEVCPRSRLFSCWRLARARRS